MPRLKLEYLSNILTFSFLGQLEDSLDMLRV